VNLVRVITLIFSITAFTLGQSIFIEPVIGLSNFEDAVFNYGMTGNYGANLGIGLAQKYDLYCGFKLMGDNANNSRYGVEYDAEISIKTYVVGTRYYINIPESNMALRLGLEYSYDSIKESVVYPVFLSNDVNTKLDGNASGYAIESGLVLNKWKILRIYLGINYRFCNYNSDKIIVNGETISEHDFESSNYLKTDNINGLGFKASVIVYSLRNN
jgi:hypothetical protein